jgi:hypothetical protein
MVRLTVLAEKRAAAQKAEADFFTLLRENRLSAPDLLWKDVVTFSKSSIHLVNIVFLQVKRKISDDPRYDAVGSSSLREELFATFLKAQGPNSTMPDATADQGHESIQKEEAVDEAEQERKRQDRKERAVKEREEKIKAERGRVEADIGRSRQGINKEEDEREFRCALATSLLRAICWWRSLHVSSYSRTMLTDAIRDPKVRLLLVQGQFLTNIFVDHLGRGTPTARD